MSDTKVPQETKVIVVPFDKVLEEKDPEYEEMANYLNQIPEIVPDERKPYNEEHN